MYKITLSNLENEVYVIEHSDLVRFSYLSAVKRHIKMSMSINMALCRIEPLRSRRFDKIKCPIDQLTSIIYQRLVNDTFVDCNVRYTLCFKMLHRFDNKMPIGFTGSPVCLIF